MELIAAVVPADNTPVETAAVTALIRSETLSPAAAVNCVKVLPVEASLMVVIDPAVSGVEVCKAGLAVEATVDAGTSG